MDILVLFIFVSVCFLINFANSRRIDKIEEKLNDLVKELLAP